MLESVAASLIGNAIALVIVWGTFALLLHVRALPFDRRARLDRGRLDLPLSTGGCAAMLPVTVALDAPDAGALAAHALERIGARDVVVLDPWTSAGWTGFTWRSIGQEVGVIVQATRPGESTLWCCSRPRLSTTLWDMGASRRSATRLREEIAALGPPPVSAWVPVGTAAAV